MFAQDKQYGLSSIMYGNFDIMEQMNHCFRIVSSNILPLHWGSSSVQEYATWQGFI